MNCTRKKDIVFVDDNEDYLRIVEIFYGQSTLKNPIKFFQSGEKFLKYMNDVNNGIYSPPSLVLLDIRMPGLNGFDVLEALEKQKIKGEIPVILMTNSDDDRDKIKAEELGVGFQTKPIGTKYIEFLNSLNFLEEK
ncbi:MAG: response regulator [Bdellovibrionota bacterium]